LEYNDHAIQESTWSINFIKKRDSNRYRNGVFYKVRL